MTTGRAFSPDELQALGDLILAAEQAGYGITIEPRGAGWSLGYISGMGGGDLAGAADLTAACRAALYALSRL